MKIVNFTPLFIERIYSVNSLNFSENKIPIASSKVLPAGGGYGISLALARSGATHIYNAGYIGSEGQMLSQKLSDLGVDTTYVRMVEGETAYQLNFKDNLGNTKRFFSSGVATAISKDFIDTVLARLTSGDYVVADNSLGNFKYLVDRAKQKGIKVFYFALGKNPQNFEKVDYLFLSKQQIKALYGFNDKEEIIKFYKSKYPNLRVVINFDSSGYLYISKNESIFQPSFTFSKNVPRICPEAFVGYFISNLSKERPINLALRYSSAAATNARVTEIPSEKQVIANINALEECVSEENDRTLRLQRKVNEYIENNIQSANIKELSKFLGYSEVYTGELIKTTLGISFIKLLQEKRCELAAKMLLGTRFSVQEIIKVVGYENESFFRNKFKALYGVSPNNYRKNGELLEFKSQKH